MDWKTFTSQTMLCTDLFDYGRHNIFHALSVDIVLLLIKQFVSRSINQILANFVCGINVCTFMSDVTRRNLKGSHILMSRFIITFMFSHSCYIFYRIYFYIEKHILWPLLSKIKCNVINDIYKIQPLVNIVVNI